MKVYIRSRRGGFGRHGHPALSCQADLSVQANRFGKAQGWESWELETVDQEQGIIALKGWNDKYLSAKDNGSVAVDHGRIGLREKWKIEDKGGGFVALKSVSYGKYLVCDDFFDNLDAIVVCRQMGYTGGTAYFDAGLGFRRFWLDDVHWFVCCYCYYFLY